MGGPFIQLMACCLLPLLGHAQPTPPSDTIVPQEVPVLLQGSLMFSDKLVGVQFGIGKMLRLKEKHVYKRPGREKITTKGQVLAGNVVYYNQPGLHQNWMATVGYDLFRYNRKGYYGEFSSFLGVSRTFLSGTTYLVNDVGGVSVKKFAGNWTLTGGLGLGVGKHFERTTVKSLKAISVRLVTQVFYPNFRFIALKPYFQLNTTWALHGLQSDIQKKVNYRYRHGAK